MLLVSSVLDLVYPRHCGGCGQPVSSEPNHLCWDCLGSLAVVKHPFCRRCGDPVDGTVEGEYVCSWCVRNRPQFDAARSAVRFRGDFRNAMHAFKYEYDCSLSRDLVPLLEACVRTHYPRVRFDAVMPVPLHPRRERERGYNQSALLARGLARSLRVDYFGRCLRRTRQTTTQTNLSAHARRENVRGAFAVNHPEWIDGRTLVLVDDVMTTGATVAECCRVLKRARAAAVYVATVARG